MLHGTLELHDIRDVEAFVARIVDRSKLELGYHDREDLSAYLLAEAWELSVGFRPGAASFSTYAGTRLRLRVAEWKRNRDGRTIWKFRDRTHERPRPKVHSLDDGRVGTAFAERAVDATPDRSPDLLRILRTRSRQVPRPPDGMGEKPYGRAA